MLCMCVCVCVVRASRERGKQMGHIVFPLWFWSWNTANYILIKYDLSVPATPRAQTSHVSMFVYVHNRETVIESETYV